LLQDFEQNNVWEIETERWKILTQNTKRNQKMRLFY